MESRPKNREWVKNAAIIFLAVLLVLTFFSKTILNRSLPEVSTQYIQSGTIKAVVRGTGTVEALGFYEVKAAETREIRAVMIRSGQQVEVGDVLFVLGEGDSAEIEAAQEQLRQLKLSYQQTALGASSYSSQLSSAQTRYNNAVAAEAAAYAQLTGNVDFQNSLTALNTAKDKLASAELNYKLANDTALQSLSGVITAFDEFENACLLQGIDTISLNDAQYALSNAREALMSADGSINSVAVAVDKTNAAEQRIQQFELANSAAISADPGAANALLTLETLLAQAQDYLSGDPQNNVADAAAAYIDAIERCNSAQNQYDGFSSMFSESYNAAAAERQAAENALNALRDSADEYNRQAALTGLSLQDLKYQIDKAEEKLASLSGGTENQIKANVSGTVSSVAVTAGKTVAKDETLATIEVPDLGYTLKFSVTNEQARRIHPGDSAKVSSSYWGMKAEAVLTAIKTDPQNPLTNKILEFDIYGDVAAGTQLSISVGEQGEMYDFVVPNNAVQSDSNGQFIYIIEARNSPLGNRYLAKRVNVQTIVKDDNNSAITGAINYGDYVITLAPSGIKNGTQVRLADD